MLVIDTQLHTTESRPHVNSSILLCSSFGCLNEPFNSRLEDYVLIVFSSNIARIDRQLSTSTTLYTQSYLWPLLSTFY